MSVSGTIRPNLQPLVTSDVRLPLGTWVASGIITHDGTGGTASALIDLDNSLVWSILHVTGYKTNTAANEYLEIALFTSDGYGIDLSVPWIKVPWGNTVIQGAQYDFPRTRPFLGGGVGGVATPLYIVAQNTNTCVEYVYAAGYYWDRKCLLEDGGPMILH